MYTIDPDVRFKLTRLLFQGQGYKSCGVDHCPNPEYLGGFRSLLASEAPPNYTRQTICWSITLVKILSLFTSTFTNMSFLTALLRNYSLVCHLFQNEFKVQGLWFEALYCSPFFDFIYPMPLVLD